MLDTSGWVHSHPDPEMLDAHNYNQDPKSFRKTWDDYFTALPLPGRYGGSSKRGIPFFVSEFGGIGWFESADGESWGYGNSPKTKDEFYERFAGLVDAQLGQSKSVWLLLHATYRRRTREKTEFINTTALPSSTQKNYTPSNRVRPLTKRIPRLKLRKKTFLFRVLLSGAPDGIESDVWNYTNRPTGGRLAKRRFRTIRIGRRDGAVFGQKGPKKYQGTSWRTKDIWLRRTFEYDGSEFDYAVLATHYDNAYKTVYQWQTRLATRTVGNDAYEGFRDYESLEGCLA